MSSTRDTGWMKGCGRIVTTFSKHVPASSPRRTRSGALWRTTTPLPNRMLSRTLSNAVLDDHVYPFLLFPARNLPPRIRLHDAGLAGRVRTKPRIRFHDADPADRARTKPRLYVPHPRKNLLKLRSGLGGLARRRMLRRNATPHEPHRSRLGESCG